MATVPVFLSLPPADHPCATLPMLLDIARRAEDAGFGGVMLSDHVVLGSHTDLYPWGTFRFASSVPWPEPLTVLTAIAAVTTHIRLGTDILVAPLRPAGLLAKTVATLDALSRGRVELGVGTGWQREEFEACGVPFETRGQATTDTMAACRALWGPNPASFTSPTVSFTDVWCAPVPTRPGGPVVLFSGTLTPRNVRRIVELGDGWIPIMREPPAGVKDGTARLRDAFAAAGRDPATLRVRARLLPQSNAAGANDLERTMAGIEELVAAGATGVGLPMVAFVDTEADVAPFMTTASRLL